MVMGMGASRMLGTVMIVPMKVLMILWPCHLDARLGWE
jgi:hypothetical protein